MLILRNFCFKINVKGMFKSIKSGFFYDFLKNTTFRVKVISFPKMYTLTDITLTLKKLWHKTFIKNLQNSESYGYSF